MKIAVMGSGGLGGLYGGRLAHAGYDVTFVARGAHLAAMKEQGLLLENEAHGDVHIPRVQVTDDPAVDRRRRLRPAGGEALGHRSRRAVRSGRWWVRRRR